MSRGSRTSVQVAMLWRFATFCRISRPSFPSPWNAYGPVRGLNAPPRKSLTPNFSSGAATLSICSSDSTAHGPAKIAS